MHGALWLAGLVLFLLACEKQDKASQTKSFFGTFGTIFSHTVLAPTADDSVEGTRYRFRDKVTGKEGDVGMRVKSGPYLSPSFINVFDCNGTSGKVSYQVEFLFKDPKVLPDNVDPTPVTGNIDCPKGNDSGLLTFSLEFVGGKHRIAFQSYSSSLNKSVAPAPPPAETP